MSLKESSQEIIRRLDVLNIGPYLVKYNVISQREYIEEYSSVIEDGRAVNGDLTPKLCNVILKKPAEFCKALEESVKETKHKDHQELLTLLQHSARQAKKVKKGLITRAAHKVKKTLKPKQKYSAPEGQSYSDNSEPERSDDEISMVSQDYAIGGQHDKQWYSSLSASHSSVALSTSSGPTIDQTKSTNEDTTNNDKQVSVVIDEPDHSGAQATTLSHDKIHEHKTKHKVECSTINNVSFTLHKQDELGSALQRANAEKQQLEKDNKALKEQILALRVEVKKNEILMQQQKDGASAREAEIQQKIDHMQSEHDSVCAEMGAKNAELILKLESLQEMYSNEFHGTVHVKQLQVRLEAERQKVKRLEKEKNATFGKQDLYKANEELTKELAQAKAEVSYLRHMVPKKYLRSEEM
ncbi:myosin heavy chain, clone 203-like isoform X1 [Dysidea avara]|uniref:myosin heavy chain, clone 203-like isoform X1 n=1 Tax=Dysidea avara TaxID=196820 RepID=UPI00331739A0